MNPGDVVVSNEIESELLLSRGDDAIGPDCPPPINYPLSRYDVVQPATVGDMGCGFVDDYVPTSSSLEQFYDCNYDVPISTGEDLPNSSCTEVTIKIYEACLTYYDDIGFWFPVVDGTVATSTHPSYFETNWDFVSDINNVIEQIHLSTISSHASGTLNSFFAALGENILTYDVSFFTTPSECLPSVTACSRCRVTGYSDGGEISLSDDCGTLPVYMRIEYCFESEEESGDDNS